MDCKVPIYATLFIKFQYPIKHCDINIFPIACQLLKRFPISVPVLMTIRVVVVFIE